MLYKLFGVIAPVFMCAGLGYAWTKLKLPFDNATITSLVTTIGAPCIVFDTLVRLQLSIDAFASMALATFMTVVAFGVLGMGFLLVYRLKFADFLPALMFPNVGNMGLPICLFAFGDTGLALAISYFAIMVFFQFTLGVALAAGNFSLRFLLRTPIVYGVIAAIVFIQLKIKPPEWAMSGIHLLAGFTIPLMLIALGVSLASLQVSNLRASLSIALARLVIGFGGGVLVVMLLGLDGVEAGVVIVQAAMPVAVFSYLFGLRYNRSPEVLAGSVLLSSLLAFAVLPGLLYFVLQ